MKRFFFRLVERFFSRGLALTSDQRYRAFGYLLRTPLQVQKAHGDQRQNALQRIAEPKGGV